MKDLLPLSIEFQSHDYLVFHPVSLILHPNSVFDPLSYILEILISKETN